MKCVFSPSALQKAGKSQGSAFTTRGDSASASVQSKSRIRNDTTMTMTFVTPLRAEVTVICQVQSYGKAPEKTMVLCMESRPSGLGTANDLVKSVKFKNVRNVVL